MSSQNNDEERSMHSRSHNIELMINGKQDIKLDWKHR